MNTTQELIDEIKRQAVDRHRLDLAIAELQGDLTKSGRRGDTWEMKANALAHDLEQAKARSDLLYTALCRIARKRACGEFVMCQAILDAFCDLNELMPEPDIPDANLPQ